MVTRRAWGCFALAGFRRYQGADWALSLVQNRWVTVPSRSSLSLFQLLGEDRGSCFGYRCASRFMGGEDAAAGGVASNLVTPAQQR